MSTPNIPDVMKPHLSDNEELAVSALGGVHRPWVPFVAWAPLYLLLLYKLMGGRTGGLDWIIVLIVAVVLLRILAGKNYVVGLTNKNVHLVRVSGTAMSDQGDEEYPLTQVQANQMNETASNVSFNIRTSAWVRRLTFADTKSLVDNKKNALEIYRALEGLNPAAVPEVESATAATVVCPHCKEEIGLDQDEWATQRFTCPICRAPVDLKSDVRPRAERNT